MLDFVSAITVLERAAVDETNFAADHFVALKMGDVDALDNPRRLGEVKRFLKRGDAFLRVDDERLRLPEILSSPLCGPARHASPQQRVDFIPASLSRSLEIQFLGRFDHVAFQALDHAFLVAIQKSNQPIDVFAIRLPPADLGRTRARCISLMWDRANGRSEKSPLVSHCFANIQMTIFSGAGTSGTPFAASSPLLSTDRRW